MSGVAAGLGETSRAAALRGGPWGHRGRVIEATGLMVIGAAAQRWVPMRRWSPLIGEAGAVPQQWRGRSVRVIPERADGPVETAVAFAIDRSLAHLPRAPSCLAQAFAGQLMLRRRGESGVVVVGLRRSEGSAGASAGDARGAWEAHAWLLGRRGALAGGPAAAGFTATTVFEVRGGLRAGALDLGASEPLADRTGPGAGGPARESS